MVVYFFGDDGQTGSDYRPTLDVNDNQATAQAERVGVLSAGVGRDVPFTRRLEPLRLSLSRPTPRVVDALRSISGAYTTVYGYDSANPSDPWQVYDTRAPEWANH